MDVLGKVYRRERDSEVRERALIVMGVLDGEAAQKVGG